MSGYGGPPPYGQGQYGGGYGQQGPPPFGFQGPQQGQFGYQQGPMHPQGHHLQHGGVGQDSFQAAGRHNKKAVLCGCNYAGSSCQLGGCINDVNCMVYLLTNKFGFQPANMRVLVDDNPNSELRPTRANMIEAMRWLTAGQQPGDSLFFHYSGHGSQQRDATGTESDGMNETLCPTDFQRAGMIIDDEVNALLINPILQGVRMHMVIDACHSGSVADMEFKASIRGGQPSWANEYLRRPQIYKGTAGGRAIQFGAATDDQTAADTNKLSGSVSTGAATFSFIQAVEKEGMTVSYGTLLHQMHRSLKSLNGGSSSGGLGSILGNSGSSGLMQSVLKVGMEMMSGRGLGPDIQGLVGSVMNMSNSSGWNKQTPVMSCNECFDFNTPLQLL